MIRYTPGQWYALVTGGQVALLAPETEPAVVEEVWVCLRAGGGVAALLQPMLRNGLAAMPPFALVRVDADVAHTVVRGDARVVVGTAQGQRQLTGDRASTWVEESVAGVVTVGITAPDAEPGARAWLPVISAVVRAAAVEADPADDAAPPEPVREPFVAREPEPEPFVARLTAPLVALTAPFVALTAPLVARNGFPPPPPAAPSVEPSAPMTQSRHAALSVHAAPSVLDAALDDHDGMTVLTGDIAALRGGLPDVGPVVDVVPVVAAPAARIRLSTGQVVGLVRPVLIGRAPQVSRVANDQLPMLVTVPSPTNDISRTHVQVRQDGDDVVVTDLHSTNGVHLHTDGAAQRLHPGEPVAVVIGAVVDIGDGVTFTVEHDFQQHSVERG